MDMVGRNSLSKGPELMDQFFNSRAAEYDGHMEENVKGFNELYRMVAAAVGSTDESWRILDLGCGTGLELGPIFDLVPNALIDGIDVSEQMLCLLREKYAEREEQLSLAKASYLDFDMGEEEYHRVVSVMSLHHLVPAVKLQLYTEIQAALIPGGLYVEGDYTVGEEEEKRLLAEHAATVGSVEGGDRRAFHVDIPFSLATYDRTLKEAGFGRVRLLWVRGSACVIQAEKSR